MLPATIGTSRKIRLLSSFAFKFTSIALTFDHQSQITNNIIRIFLLIPYANQESRNPLLGGVPDLKGWVKDLARSRPSMTSHIPYSLHLIRLDNPLKQIARTSSS